MDTKIHITLGFRVGDIFFGWVDGNLYQLPYTYNGRYFGLRKLKPKKTKDGWVYYHVRRKKVGMEKLKAMLESVKWEVDKPIDLNKK